MSKKNLAIFLILLSGFILNVLSVQIVGSSFKLLQGALGASVEQISYVMSASLIAEVIIIPFTGWLSRLLSTRRLFLISLTGFLFASIGCGLANSFLPMVIFRGLQGFFGGAMLPLMTASIYTLFKSRQIPFILSIAATFGVSSFALGPILGGILTESLSWRWMFLYNIPIGIVIMFLAFIFMDLSERDSSLLKDIDYQGIFFLALGLISLLVFIEEGERRDWFESNFIFTMFSIAFVSLSYFLFRELTTKNPVIQLSVFQKRNFSIGCINLTVFSITSYVPMLLLPIYLGEIRNMDPLEIGIIVSTLGIAWMISGPFVGKFLEIFGARLVVVMGCLLIGLGTFSQTKITSEYTFNELFLSQVLKGIGAQFLWIGNQYISLSDIPKKAIYNASSVFNLVLRLTAAICISLASSFFYRWKIKFYSQIGENSLGNSSQLNQNQVNEMFSQNNITVEQKQNLIIQLLSERESILMSLNTIFFYSTWTVLIPIFLMFYIKTDNKNTLY